MSSEAVVVSDSNLVARLIACVSPLPAALSIQRLAQVCNLSKVVDRGINLDSIVPLKDLR
jgi:hypothetical protein